MEKARKSTHGPAVAELQLAEEPCFRMKAIRPITIVTVGPVLLAVAFAAGTLLVLPSSRHLLDAAWAFVFGAVGGLAFFGPIAALAATKARHPDWWVRYSFRIAWYTSLAMALSLGYLAACTRHGAFDSWALAAVGVVGLGAAMKIGLSDALQPKIDTIR